MQDPLDNMTVEFPAPPEAKEPAVISYSEGSPPPADVLDGIIYDMSLQIGEYIDWIDTCFTGEEKATEARKLDALKLSYAGTRAHLDPIIKALQGVHPKTLAPLANETSYSSDGPPRKTATLVRDIRISVTRC